MTFRLYSTSAQRLLFTDAFFIDTALMVEVEKALRYKKQYATSVVICTHCYNIKSSHQPKINMNYVHNSQFYW